MKDAENNRQGKTDKTERSLQDERRIGLIGLLATDKQEPEIACPSSEEMALFLEQKLGKKSNNGCSPTLPIVKNVMPNG